MKKAKKWQKPQRAKELESNTRRCNIANYADSKANIKKQIDLAK